MNLQEQYDRDTYLEFLRTFVPGFKQDIRAVVADKLAVTQEAQFLGESEELDLSVFELTHTSSTDARVSLSMDGFKLMKTSATYRALIVYRSENSEDWRFSLMTATPDLDEKGKVVRKLSNPRRFSFFLGPNAKINTPNRFLIKEGPVRDFADLQSRFSLEVVNKEFYKQISEKFTQLVGGTLGTGKKQKTYEPLIKLPSQSSKSQENMEFGVRLIGRIIFCWFLREKKSKNNLSLMPVELLSSGAISKNSHYYHSILEPIFFEVLNKEQRSRREEFSSESYSLIPYLNGGLFSPHKDDYYQRPNGEQSIFHNTLVIPDAWLKELFEILETYNFTIDENTSFDEELSIDPEMLGRIFENLLAEINPETGESARKSTGSYYTPRVIVDYMVDESLLLYLQEHTKIPEEKLRAVVSYDLSDDAEYKLTEEEKKLVVQSLGKLKLLDPACGSGAFPIGALQKIVFILQQIDPDGKHWLQKQLENAHPEFRRDIEKKFSNRELDFLRKLGIIRECIFGVDIQPIATEIARLRCFLTLIVDERIDDEEENRGIKPLPNLDFKFVTANSLIGLPTNQFTLFKDKSGIDQLKTIRDQFFAATNSERHQLKDGFKEAQKQMLLRMINIGGGDDLTQKLSAWDPFSHSATDWFDPEWMFGISNGFDIIIGNPPYNAKLTKNEREFFKDKYESVSKGRQDTAAIFVELGLRILKENGRLSFILPYRLFSRARNHGQFQIFALKNSDFKQIIYLGSNVGFSANDEFMIFLSTKGYTDKKVKIFFKPNLESNFSANSFLINQSVFLNNKEVNLNLVKYDQRILRKIEEDTFALDIVCHVKDGIVPYIRDKMISENKIDHRYVKFAGIAGTYDLNKYSFCSDSLFLCYDINEAMKYISDPIELRKVQLRDKSIFLSRKIMTAQNSAVLKGTIDEDQLFVSNSIHSTFLRKEFVNDYELEYILGLVNSKLINFYHNSLRLKGTDLHPQVLVGNLKKLPIKKIGMDEQKEFADIANEIIQMKKKGLGIDTSSLENKIDKMVYKLYGLTPEEIEIVESSSK